MKTENNIENIIIWLQNYQRFCYDNSKTMRLDNNGITSIKTNEAIGNSAKAELISQILIKLEKVRTSLCSRCHPSHPVDPDCHICGGK